MKLTDFCSSLSVLAAAGILATAMPAQAQTRITFQDIYENPDDQDLNLAYARQQAAAGELSDAAAALERMLFYTPDWDSARLFYASILYDLDDRAAAKREFEILRSRPLSSEDQEIVSRYLEALESGGQARSYGNTGWSARVVLSARYDDNAGGVFGDVVFGNQKVADESAGISASVRYGAMVDGDPNVVAYVAGSAQIRRHEDVSDADFDVYGLRAGLTGQGAKSQWRAELQAQDLTVGGEDYLEQIGLVASYGYGVTDWATLSVHGGWYDRNFDPLPGNPGATDRSGDLAEIGLGATLRPLANLRISTRAMYQTVSAEAERFAYDGPRYSANLRYDVTPSIYLSGRAIYRELNYEGNSIFVFPPGPRKDDNLILRAAAGIKASSLLPGSGGIMDDVTIELGVNHSERGTNIPGRDFENTGGELRLIFDF